MGIKAGENCTSHEEALIDEVYKARQEAENERAEKENERAEKERFEIKADMAIKNATKLEEQKVSYNFPFILSNHRRNG